MKIPKKNALGYRSGAFILGPSCCLRIFTMPKEQEWLKVSVRGPPQSPSLRLAEGEYVCVGLASQSCRTCSPHVVTGRLFCVQEKFGVSVGFTQPGCTVGYS